MQQLQQNITYTYRTQNGEAFIRREYNNTTLYASPYLVATNKGYTKHYYAESERIASKIGGGGLQNLHAVCDELYTDNTSAGSAHVLPRPYAELPELDFEAKRDSSKMHLKRLADCVEGEMGEIKKNALVVLNQYAAGAQASPHSEDECYWYHPDHLGSASWVSDKAGKGIQHLYYLPWGEELDNQRATDYASRYTFSGKERDEETGYSYFGARYYNSDLSIWLSVDPLADKYPGLSPYTYCADNPVKLVDPDGRDIWEITESIQDNKKCLTITKVKNTTDFDRIDVIANGKTIKGIEKRYGTVREHPNEDKMFFFDINNDEMAKNTFENLADNTSFEWTYAAIGKEGSNRNIVGTSYSEKSTCIAEFLFQTGYNLRSVTHNHPSGSGWPSNKMLADGTRYGDLVQAKKYEEKFPNIKLYIYVNGSHPKSAEREWCQKGYHPYNSIGPILKDNIEVKLQ